MAGLGLSLDVHDMFYHVRTQTARLRRVAPVGAGIAAGGLLGQRRVPLDRSGRSAGTADIPLGVDAG
jgi:hypothetical protein